jgi:hypothetical protein
MEAALLKINLPIVGAPCRIWHDFDLFEGGTTNVSWWEGALYFPPIKE